MQVDQYMLLAFVVLSWLAIIGAFFLGAWVGFHVRTAGTGFRLSLPKDKESDDKPPETYAKDMKHLFEDYKEVLTLTEEPLSDAAKRIREQKRGGGPISEVMEKVRTG